MFLKIPDWVKAELKQTGENETEVLRRWSLPEDGKEYTSNEVGLSTKLRELEFDLTESHTRLEDSYEKNDILQCQIKELQEVIVDLRKQERLRRKSNEGCIIL